MSEPHDRGENFLQRWTRRKQAADASPHADTMPESTGTEDNAPPPASTQSAQAPMAFDPSSLPPLESIGATTDIRPFLLPGVPEALTREALRRAWLTDPIIRNFIGIAENQWDFTKADGVPGFGPLELTEELRRMADRLVGRAPKPTPLRHEPDRDPSDQGDEKPTEIDQAPAHRTISAFTARSGVDAAPRELGSIREATPGSLSATASKETINGAPQPKTGETAERPSTWRRHGGAVPK